MDGIGRMFGPRGALIGGIARGAGAAATTHFEMDYFLDKWGKSRDLQVLKEPLINSAFSRNHSLCWLMLFIGRKGLGFMNLCPFLSRPYDLDGLVPTSTSVQDAPEKNWPTQTG